ncbi:MAG: hypothetical protein V1696_04000 [Candidatus Jorgensenbacteria bacterium]
MKHPLATYNVSFGKVESDLQDFFVAYKNIEIRDFLPENKSDEKIKEALKRYRVFLYSLREYLDDCFHVVKTFIPPQPQFRYNKNQYDWLKQNIIMPHMVSFLSKIDTYKKFLDSIVNELKHNNAVLNGIVFYDTITKDFSLGYYIANVFNGRYEPVEKIHQKFHNQDTAFSFARDIRYNSCNIFQLSEELVEFIVNGLKLQIPVPTQERTPNEERRLLYEDISNLPRYFFPDEYQKDVPSVVLRENSALKLELPSKLSLRPLHHNRVLLYHSGDGKTRSFALLYYSGE